MPLRLLTIDNLRCIQHAELELDPRLTLIHGPNGSGKTSLLEAIFLLGRGRSFRSARLGPVIRRGERSLRVVGHVTEGVREFTIGIEARAHQVAARIAGEAADSLAALSTAFPVQVIEPGIHKLIEEGPVRRRRFLDWGVFHVEPRYLHEWQRFHRILRQRNAALRALASDEELDSWDQEFARAGEEVTRARLSYLEGLKSSILACSGRLLGSEDLQLEYAVGWADNSLLAEALRAARTRDRQRRTSTLGPHRADLVVKAGSALARDVLSRGQQKLVATAMVLGQLTHHVQLQGMQPTLLLDDPAAELDHQHLERFLADVRRLDAQVVATSLQPDVGIFGTPCRVFHVEQGTVSRV